MRKKTNIVYLVLLVLVWLVCFPTAALAYFDPGTGSMLLQMLGVAFIAMGGFFIAFKNRIFAFFRRNKKGSDADADDMDDMDDPDDAVAGESGADAAPQAEPKGDEADNE